MNREMHASTEVNTPFVQSLDPTERKARKDVETMLKSKKNKSAKQRLAGL